MTLAELKLSCHRALLFSVIECVKFIFIKIENDVLVIFVYTDRELTSEERDIYYSMGGEICGDFPELSVSDVSFIITEDSYDNVEKLELLIYARYEYLKNEEDK